MAKQVGSKSGGTRSRKKTIKKETARVTKALNRNSLLSADSIASPDFEGNLVGRRSRASPDESVATSQKKPKLQLVLRKMEPMPLPDKCQCSRSKCLKLYCECFAKGGFCGPECGCTECCNKAGEEDAIKAAQADIMKRDPLAFVKKIELNESKQTLQHRKGCTCKRSGCSKGYCECF